MNPDLEDQTVILGIVLVHAALMKYQRLVFLMVLETRSSRSGCQHDRVLGEVSLSVILSSQAQFLIQA